jgi:predicted alpha/beta superfamily hydrolase
MLDHVSPPDETIVEVVYPPQRGTIGLCGNHAPLSWEKPVAPTVQEGERHVFSIAVPPRGVLELKVVRNQEDWSQGRNYVVHAGDHLHLEPCFDRNRSELLPRETFGAGETAVSYQVLLPPSYLEQETKRYPVIYAQDGQSLWSTSEDPFGVWHLDSTIDELYELGVIEEVIVVAVDTSDRRLERLSHVADSKHGGGQGEAHLHVLAELAAHIDATFRTRADRSERGVLGASMGGLFSFLAAWSRPDLFGKAACLSPSFWWADRHAIRLVQGEGAPAPRPILYLDSGAAWNALESDANLRDGFHHTRSMVRALSDHGYRPGFDLHRLTFTGQAHSASSWAARVAIPLQMLFPAPGRAPDPEAFEAVGVPRS